MVYFPLKRKNADISEFILTSPILDISYPDKDENSYLHLAVINRLKNILRILINIYRIIKSNLF